MNMATQVRKLSKERASSPPRLPRAQSSTGQVKLVEQIRSLIAQCTHLSSSASMSRSLADVLVFMHIC